MFTVNPSFSLRNSGQFVCLNFEQAYLEHISSKLGDSCCSVYLYQYFTSFMKSTFSLEAYFILKHFVQHIHASFDQFYQKDHKSRFIAPMRLKLVPKFNRLNMIQLSRRHLVLEMLERCSTIICKSLLNIRYEFQKPTFAFLILITP